MLGTSLLFSKRLSLSFSYSSVFNSSSYLLISSLKKSVNSLKLLLTANGGIFIKFGSLVIKAVFVKVFFTNIDQSELRIIAKLQIIAELQIIVELRTLRNCEHCRF